MRQFLSKPLFGLMLIGSPGAVLAFDGDKPRERVREQENQAEKRKEHESREKAEQQKRKAAELAEQAENQKARARDEKHAELESRELRGRLEDLLAQQNKLKESKASEKELAEVRERIADTERQLARISGGRAKGKDAHREGREPAEELEAAIRRIAHIRAAVKSLKLAEVHDVARALAEQADLMQRDVEEARQRHARDQHKPRGEERGHEAELRELRQEIERLHAENKELRKKLEKR